MNLARHVATVLVVLGGLAGMASAKDKVTADPEIPAADASKIKMARENGLVIHDGKGHYLVFTSQEPGREKSEQRAVFYGDGTTFYRVFVKGFRSDNDASSTRAQWNILDERFGPLLELSTLTLRNQVYTMTCRERTGTTELKPLAPADARALLEKATFKTYRMDRRAYAVGRDGTTYYYVDVAIPENSTDFRVYVGKRGAMKLLKITDQAVDSKGVVFSSKVGTLRITTLPLALRWAVTPKKQVELSTLPIESNLELIYSELGVYAGKKFGVPCDDL